MAANNEQKNKQIEIINIYATLTASVAKKRYCTTYIFKSTGHCIVQICDSGTVWLVSSVKNKLISFV